MPTRLHRRLAILNKIETTYGTNSTPGAVNAIVGTNVSFTPLEAEEIGRDLHLPHMGHQGVILTGQYAKIEFDVEIAGAGAAGTVPKYGSLLRACGMAEVVTAGTSVVYSIIEDAAESSTLLFISDKVQHVLLGCRGTFSMSFEPKQIPKFRFSMTGLLGTILDAVMPAVSMTGWSTPVAVSKDATTMTLHGWSSIASKLSVELGNTGTPRFLIGAESMLITDRQSVGEAVVDALSLAEMNWFTRAQGRTRGALSLVHGVAAGNRVEISAPAVEIGKPSQGQSDGVVTYTLPLALCPTTGRDELTITVR